MDSLKNKVVIITGSSSGIGAAAAIKLASLGAHVVIQGRNIDKLNEVFKKCAPAKPLIVPGDICDERIANEVVKKTLEKHSKIDILVNSVGILENGSIENTSLEQFDRVFNVNVRSVYNLISLVTPHLVASKGNIVNVSSVCGTRAFPNVLSYCMSKAALDQLTKCVALELANRGVRVNSVNPGVITSGLHLKAGMSAIDYQTFLSKCKSTHALGRAGECEEVANVIAFLASDLASFTTGEIIHVDGGRNVMCPR